MNFFLYVPEKLLNHIAHLKKIDVHLRKLEANN